MWLGWWREEDGRWVIVSRSKDLGECHMDLLKHTPFDNGARRCITTGNVPIDKKKWKPTGKEQ